MFDAWATWTECKRRKAIGRRFPISQAELSRLARESNVSARHVPPDAPPRKITARLPAGMAPLGNGGFWATSHHGDLDRD